MLALNVRSTGLSIDDMIRSVRDVPARLVPYAAATALTRTAKIAQATELPAEMNRVFDRPTPYTLNSLFLRPATAQSLSARIHVKNQSGGGLPQEKFLTPEVFGGGRNQKGFEVALRLSGWLKPGEFVFPARGVARDAFGNVTGAFVRRILAQIAGQTKGGIRRRRIKGGSAATKSGVFVGDVKGTRGIWQRTGLREVKPLFIFSAKTPSYKTRLDFAEVAEKVALEHFPQQFADALTDLLAKQGRSA